MMTKNAVNDSREIKRHSCTTHSPPFIPFKADPAAANSMQQSTRRVGIFNEYKRQN